MSPKSTVLVLKFMSDHTIFAPFLAKMNCRSTISMSWYYFSSFFFIPNNIIEIHSKAEVVLTYCKYITFFNKISNFFSNNFKYFPCVRGSAFFIIFVKILFLFFSKLWALPLQEFSYFKTLN